MKILYNTNAVIPSRSAHSIHGMKMCQAFAQDGHEVTLLAPAWGSGHDARVQNLFRFYGVENCFQIRKSPFPNGLGKIGIYTSFLVTMRRALHKIQPQIVYGPFACGCYFAALQGCSTILESHVPFWDGHQLEKLFFDKLIKKRGFKKLVVISQTLKDMYLRAGYLSDESIQVAHNGADENWNSQSLTDWPGRKGALQVGYMGHLYPGRGIDLILELGRQMPDLDFHLVGGTDEDIQYWRSQAREDNIFFHGHVAPESIHRYRNSCDVLLAPYQQKVALLGGRGDTSKYMSPMKIFEYMAGKKPMVASDLPVLREVLNVDNAVLVPPEDVLAWKEALVRLQDEALRNRLSSNAYDDFKKKHQWRQRAKLVLEGS